MNLGNEVNAYYAVAVARRRDTELTLFNMKRKSRRRRNIHTGQWRRTENTGVENTAE